MQHELSTTNLVRQLQRVGVRPPQRLVEQILARGQASVEPLLEMALDTTALAKEEPASLAPVHALRLLGELRPLEAAARLLRSVELPDNVQFTQAIYLWEDEVPQIVARFGAEVLPIALGIAEDETASQDARGAALDTLAFLAGTEPALRDRIVEELRTRLKGEQDPEIKAYIVSALAEIGAREAYADVMAEYRKGSIDKREISAADARQKLLGSQDGRRIECARHTLDERYDQHGPYTREQQEAMAELARRRRYG